MFAHFQKTIEVGLTCSGCGAELAAFDRKLAEIGKNIEDAKRNRDPKLVADLERLAGEVVTASRRRLETQKAFDAAKSTRDKDEGAYDDYMQKNRATARAARRDRARQMRQDFPRSTAMRDYRPEVAGMATEAIPNRIDGLTAERVEEILMTYSLGRSVRREHPDEAARRRSCDRVRHRRSGDRDSGRVLGDDREMHGHGGSGPRPDLQGDTYPAPAARHRQKRKAMLAQLRSEQASEAHQAVHAAIANVAKASPG